MTYETFKELTMQQLPKVIPDEYKSLKLRFYRVPRVNETLDAVAFYLEGARPFASPNIYMKELYEQYLSGDDFEMVLCNCASNLCYYYEQGKDIPEKIAGLDIRDKVVFQMINKEQNKELLQNAPHRDFLDGALIYRVMVEQTQNGTASAIVFDDLAKKHGLNEKDLYELAYENTKRILPPDVRTMQSILGEAGLVELEELALPMLVLTNESKLNGACLLVYEDLLYDIATKTDRNLTILPSSIHESIILFEAPHDLDYLAEMVHDVNMNEVRLDERLSNQVYRYDKDERRLYVATNSPYKRLDGKDMEPVRSIEVKALSR